MSIISQVVDVLTKPLWILDLVDSSWKGQEFEVTSVTYNINQRMAVKELPYRNMPRVEPLGLAAQRIQVEGFLIGDDVWDQRDAFLKIAKDGIAGEVVIPSRGPLVCRLETASFSESVADGNKLGLDLAFIIIFDPDTPDLPDYSKDPVSGIKLAAGDVSGALSADFKKQYASDRSAYLGKRALLTVAAGARSVLNDASRLVALGQSAYLVVQNSQKPRYGRTLKGGADVNLSTALAAASVLNSAVDRVNKVVSDVTTTQNSLQQIATQQINLTTATGVSL